MSSNRHEILMNLIDNPSFKCDVVVQTRTDRYDDFPKRVAIRTWRIADEEGIEQSHYGLQKAIVHTTIIPFEAIPTFTERLNDLHEKWTEANARREARKDATPIEDITMERAEQILGRSMGPKSGKTRALNDLMKEFRLVPREKERNVASDNAKVA
jgi:hypothetical protein